MSPERVVLVHSAYQQLGGEDRVVAAELALLRSKGHEVIELRRDNWEITTMGRAQLAAQTLWSRETQRQALGMLRQHRPDVVHVHNTFPLVSPSIYWACAKAGVPVVQTLHNYRLACPQAMLFRNGGVCEKCLGKTPWPSLVHGCYRKSRLQTAVLFGMISLHRTIRTFDDKVARYIVPNEFSRAKFEAAGLPPERLTVKPNFADVPPPDERRQRQGLLFVGRLSAEKGLDVLQVAWRDCPGMSLRVAGAGPAGAALASQHGVAMLGLRSAEEVQSEMHAAMAQVLPSLCFENCPRTLLEAFGSGLPVIASRIGALSELIEHGATGLLFEPGNAEDLGRQMRWAQAHPDEMATMGANARARYEALYSPDVNYEQLRAIYRSAIEERQCKDLKWTDAVNAKT